MDSRFEVAYPLWLEEEIFDFYMARQGWKGLLAKYPTDAVLVPTRLPVARYLQELAGWRRCYKDDSSEIYIRINGDLPPVDQRGRQHLGAFP